MKGEVVTDRFDIDENSITNINFEGDELQLILIGHLNSDDFFHTTLFRHWASTIEQLSFRDTGSMV